MISEIKFDLFCIFGEKKSEVINSATAVSVSISISPGARGSGPDVPYVELKEDVVVGVLVGEGDRALLLQVDGVNQRHGALVTVRLQIHALRRPRRAATTKHTV